MSKENTDLQAVVFKDTQTLLRKYLVKLKRFLVPADEKQGIPGPCAQAGAKAGQ
jgi:inactivated superfamily I helicase